MSTDPPTFKAVYRENIRHILKVIRCRGVPPADREDAAQEALLKIDRYRHALDSNKGSIRAYVGRIAWQQAGEYLDAEGRKRGAPLGFVHEELDAAAIHASGPTSEEIMVQEEERRFLYETLERMPEGQCAAFKLHVLEDMSVEDVAIILGVPERTITYWLARAREELEAAGKRRRAADQRRGAVVVPIGIASLLTRERACLESITDAQCERVWARFLRSREEEAQRAASAAPLRSRLSDPWGRDTPPRDPTGWLPTDLDPARTLRTAAGAGLLGGVAGGAVVWWLLHSVPVPPTVTVAVMSSAIPNAGQVAPPLGAGAAPGTWIPAGGGTATPSMVLASSTLQGAAPASNVPLAPPAPSRRPAPLPSSTAGPEDPEETVMRRVREALAAGDFAAARDTLDTLLLSIVDAPPPYYTDKNAHGCAYCVSGGHAGTSTARGRSPPG